MSADRTIESTTRAVYTVSEADFKAALGITDPERVLDVSTDWRNGTITIRMERQP